MIKKISKRRFLAYLGALPLGLAVLKVTGFNTVLSSSALAAEVTPMAASSGPFTLPSLPYAKTALEKVIDGKTMDIHHGKHHQGYIDNLNKEVAKTPSLQGKSLEEIIGHISKYEAVVRNNAGGHWNHNFFWNIMTPNKTTPSPVLDAAISASFGSMDDFKTKFEDAGKKQFGSGWVWLIVDGGGKLHITTTPNQDNPLMDDAKVKGTPILGNDVWEHAYYLRYQNKRGDYLKNWWNVVNWTRVSALYDSVNKK